MKGTAIKANTETKTETEANTFTRRWGRGHSNILHKSITGI